MVDGKIKPESPERLRECLDALSRAAGLAVYRCEFQITENGAQVILTCSPEMSEPEIAALVIQQLQPIVSGAFPPSEKLAALRAEIEQLRAVGQKLANVAFNWKQEANHIGGRLGEQDRAELAALQASWDAIPRAEKRMKTRQIPLFRAHDEVPRG